MSSSPTFTSTPRTVAINVASGNTGRDGSGTPTALITGAAAGTKVLEIVAQATVTTTAGMVRIFITTDNGSNIRLFDEFPIAVATVSASVAGIRVSKTYSNLLLADANAKLYATTHNSESINVVAFAADLT